MMTLMEDKKALSSVLVTVLLIALTVMASITFAVWVGTVIYSSSTKAELLRIVNHTWTSSPIPDTEVVRAAQVFPYEDFREEFISEIKAAGVNMIFYEVFGWGGVYFNTTYAPVLDDLLNHTIEVAHANGIKVYAWMTILSLDWVLQEHPEWAVIAYDYNTGEYMVGQGYYRASPFVPEFIDYLKNLYRDLARYDIDGIMFQDDLVLGFNEDFSTYANASYYADFGRSLDPLDMYDLSKWGIQTEAGWEWIRWKSVKLMTLANQVMNAVHQVNPKVKFVLDAYAGTTYMPVDSVTWFGQNITLAVEYNFDYVAIMSYQHGLAKIYNMTMDEACLLMKNMTEAAVRMTGNASKVIMKIQAHDFDTSEVLSEEEIRNTLEAILSTGYLDVGIGYFAHRPDLPLKTIGESWQIYSSTSDGIKLDIINAGSSSVVLDCVTVNGVIFTNVTFTPSTLQPGSSGEVYIRWPYKSGTRYRITIITKTGTQISYTAIAPSSHG
jgi:biofilm PGA synthesis lipoprotein PgaB